MEILTSFLPYLTSFFIGVVTNLYTDIFRNKRTIALFIAVILIFFSFFVNNMDLFMPKTSAKIIRPNDSAKISRNVNFYGEYNNIRDKKLWIYVFAPKAGENSEGRYYLNRIDDLQTSKKTWTIKNLVVGESDSKKEEQFEIGLLAVDSKTNEALNLNHIDLDKLPENTNILHKISVYRKIIK